MAGAALGAAFALCFEMIKRELKQITIRPQQQFTWLGLAALLFGGALAAGNVYGRGVWLFAFVFASLLIGCVCETLVFDGQHIKRRGPKALFDWLILGRKRELALEEIETISTIVNHTGRDGAIVYRTTISGAGLRWVISSRRPSYASLINSLFGAVSPNILDPRSRDLLNYWPERKQLNIWQSAALSPALMTPSRMWRRLANNFALAGQFEAAAGYFRLAYRQNPRNAQLLYELARFLRLRAALEKQPTEASKQRMLSHRQIAEIAKWRKDSRRLSSTAYLLSPPAYYSRRAEACLRLAGRLAREDGALLERIGETFFELHQDRLALHYFERALQADSHRVRASIGLAEVALRSGQAARVVYYYRAAARAAEAQGDDSLARLAERQADYYERLRADDRFLDAEMWRLDLLDQLKWARRGAMFAFLAAWLVHLTCYQFAPSVQEISREISATSAIIWLTTITASYFFSQRRN
jgi:tetratricopeptide (TPR) repeat protein